LRPFFDVVDTGIRAKLVEIIRLGSGGPELPEIIPNLSAGTILAAQE